MSIPQPYHRLPNHSPIPPSSPKSPSSQSSEKENLAKRVKNLAIKILSKLGELFIQPFCTLFSWVFSFCRARTPKKSNSPHSPKSDLPTHNDGKFQTAFHSRVSQNEIAPRAEDIADSPSATQSLQPNRTSGSPQSDGTSSSLLLPQVESFSNSTAEINNFIQVSPDGEITAIDQQFPFTLAGSINFGLQNNQLSPHLRLLFSLPSGVPIGRANLQGCDKNRHPYFKKNFPEIYKLFKFENLDCEDHRSWELILIEIRKGLSKPQPDEVISFFVNLNYHLFRSMILLPFAEHYLESKFQLDTNAILKVQLDNLANQIASPNVLRKIARDPGGFLNTQRHHLTEKLIHMDGALYNPPFLAGSMRFQNKKDSTTSTCYQLHYSTPTYKFLSSVTITPEYARFVSKANDHKQNILHSSLQSLGNGDDPSLKELKDLEKNNRNFFLIILPSIENIENETIDSKDTFCNYLEKIVINEQLRAEREFYLTDSSIDMHEQTASLEMSMGKIPYQFISQRLHIWTDFLKNHFINDSDVLFDHGIELNNHGGERAEQVRKNRAMYLTLLQSLLRQDIIHQFKINFCNNTCKDISDSATVHQFFDIYWSLLMNDQEQDDQVKKYLTYLTFFPAIFEKNEAIQPHNLDILKALLARIDSLSSEEIIGLKHAWSHASLVKFSQFTFAHRCSSSDGFALDDANCENNDEMTSKPQV